jgi:hypothetical protein
MERERIKVFIANREATCEECGEGLGRGAWITLQGEKGAVCLACSDLDHLVFLPRGNAALSRRAQKNSILSAVVLKWSRARRRYERQGLLVVDKALEKAEIECLADQEARTQRREREATRRAELDREYLESFASRVRESFPGCPSGRERIIAEHACLKYSGRIGRTSAAKKLDETAVRLAVTAHIRHAETPYDELLATGYERRHARTQVDEAVRHILSKWKDPQREMA